MLMYFFANHTQISDFKNKSKIFFSCYLLVEMFSIKIKPCAKKLTHKNYLMLSHVNP